MNQEKYAKSAEDLVELTKDLKKYNGLKPLLDDPEVFSFWDLARKDVELAKEQFVDVIDAIVPGSTLDKFQKTEYFLQEIKPTLDLGNALEDLIAEAFKNTNSEVYKKMLSMLPDLGERTILRKVYLCLSGNCKDKGTYFIADFAFVKAISNSGGAITGWEIVIADSKLTQFTKFTTNQNKAKALDGFKLKSQANDIYSEPFTEIASGAIIKRSVKTDGRITPYYKLYGQGDGQFSNILE